MSIIINELGLIKQYLVMSFKNQVQFPVDFAMNFVNVLFDLLSLVLFWYSISTMGIVVENWSGPELVVFIAMNTLAVSVGGIFFGFRDLEYDVINGKFDKYLIRPVNAMKSVILEKFHIFSILSRAVVAAGLLVAARFVFDVELHHGLCAFAVLCIGTTAYQVLYGTVSLLTFWVGKIYTAREIIFSFRKAQDYPLDIFPKIMQGILTYVMPLGFMSYIPTVILLGKTEDGFMWIVIALALCVIIYLIFKTVLKYALLRYSSTGS